MLDLRSLLQTTIRRQASDLHLKADSVPHLRVHGELQALEDAAPLSREEMSQLGERLLNSHQKDVLARKREVDLSFSELGMGRFRLSIFHQRGTVSAVFRSIPDAVSTIDELNLPEVLKEIICASRGLVLTTGATGSGKSTTLAAMIRHINESRKTHIITIEDPIEFLFPDGHSLISQREVSVDTRSFSSALRSALRQDSDIIMVGDLRDLETVRIAIQAAETGHLVLSTLHTPDAVESVHRIVSIFPASQQNDIRFQFAAAMQAVISIRLIRSSVTGGRVPAVEVLRNTKRVRSLIEKVEQVKEIEQALETGGSQYGMHSFDQSIFELYQRGLINKNDALQNATSPEDLKLRIQGIVLSSETI